MEPHYYLLRERNYLPASCVDILLGRIVQNYGDPTAEFCPPESAHLEKGTLIRNSIQIFLIKGLGSSSKGPKIDMQRRKPSVDRRGKDHKIRASGLIPIGTGGLIAMGVPLAAPLGDINIGGRHATAANVEVTGSIDELVIIGLQLRIVRRCTYNDVKLRRKGPRVRKG
ncbi:MAG: hypothetical protein Q9161_001971 [Pseudevernia consocians]